jgi:hypothetical protein
MGNNKKEDKNDRFDIDPESILFITNNKKESGDQKQNMTLPGFSTTKDLDLQLEGILKSIEPDVMKAVEKIMPKSH